MPQSYFPNLPTPTLPTQRRAAVLQNRQAEANIQRSEQAMRLADLQEGRSAEMHRLDVEAAPVKIAAQKISNTQGTQKIVQDVMTSAQADAYGIMRSVPEGTPEYEKAAQNYVATLRTRLQALETTPGLEEVTQRFDQMALDTPPTQILKQMAGVASQGSGKGATYKVSKPFEYQGKYYDIGIVQNGVLMPPAGAVGVEKREDLGSVQSVQLQERAKQKEKTTAAIRKSTWEDVTDNIDERFRATSNKLQNAAQMMTALEGVDSGPMAQQAQAIRSVAQFFGAGTAEDAEISDVIGGLKALTQNQVANRIGDTKGAVSDAEFKTFIDSVPSISKIPGGNAWILATMSQIAELEQSRNREVKRLNQLVVSGELTVGEALSQLNDFDDKRSSPGGAIHSLSKDLKQKVSSTKEQLGGEIFGIDDFLKSFVGSGGMTKKSTTSPSTSGNIQEDLLEGF